MDEKPALSRHAPVTTTVDVSRHPTELRFRRGAANADEIQQAVDELLAELGDPASTAATAARDAGYDPDELARARIRVRESGQGLDPMLVQVIVGIAVALGTKAAESYWTDIIWPRIRRRLGVDALNERADQSDA